MYPFLRNYKYGFFFPLQLPIGWLDIQILNTYFELPILNGYIHNHHHNETIKMNILNL